MSLLHRIMRGRAIAAACALVIVCGVCATAFPAASFASDDGGSLRVGALGKTAIQPQEASLASATAPAPGKLAKVPDGAYALRSRLGKGMTLDLANPGGGLSGGQLALRGDSGGQPSVFYIRSEGGRRYSVQLAGTKLFVTQKKGKVILRSWSGDDAQLWWATGGTGVSFVNVKSGRTLAVKGDVAEDGSRVVALQASKARKLAKACRWKLVSQPLIATGWYSLHNPYGTYLSVQGSGYGTGASIVADVPNDNYCFRIKAVGKRYRIVNSRSLQAVAVRDAAKHGGARMVQVPAANDKAQLWKAMPDRLGRIVFTNANSGKVLALQGTSPGVPAFQRKASGKKGESWRLTRISRLSVTGDVGLDRSLARILADHSDLRSAYDYVRDEFHWNDPDTAYRSGKYMSYENTVRYAKEMVREGKGSCYCTSSLFMWLARALGYDADVTVGYLESSIPGAVGAHSWIEVRENGVAYVCDPDSERGYRFRDWYMKTYDTTPAEYHFW